MNTKKQVILNALRSDFSAYYPDHLVGYVEDVIYEVEELSNRPISKDLEDAIRDELLEKYKAKDPLFYPESKREAERIAQAQGL